MILSIKKRKKEKIIIRPSVIIYKIEDRIES